MDVSTGARLLGRGDRVSGGAGLDRIDVVLTAQGLGSFSDEYAGAKESDLDGVRVRILPLERVISSKRVVGRAKDLA
jgi:hypothetical protein